MKNAKIDPITLEILWRRLDSTVDELSATLVRTAFSPVVRDVNDYACAIFDREARLLAQSRDSTPGLCGPLNTMLRYMISQIPPEDLEDGDVLIANDPWNGSGHHNDISVMSPAFHDGNLVGYVVTCCHHVDIGGRRATTESRDNYEEGLRIPVAKIFKRGEANDDVFAFITSNVRSAGTVVGDLRAQFAANHVGIARLTGICKERGWSDLQALADEMLERSERLARDEIRKIPNGVYRHEATVDTVGEEDILLKVAVHVTDDEMVVDYDGSSPQVKKAINCTLTYTSSYTLFGLNCLLALPVSMNYGTQAPLTIKAPEGSILNAPFPAPVFGRTSTGNFLPEIIMTALSQAVPDRVIAGAGSTPLWAQYMFGKRQDGTEFAPMNSANGGLGARAHQDGVSCLAFPFNVGNTPAETLEGDAPVLVRQRALWENSEGAGKYRGGFGQQFILDILTEERGPDGSVLIGFRGGRFSNPVPGLLGGKATPTARLLVNGTQIEAGMARTLAPGDSIECHIPGGGGLGDPKDRDRDAIEQDMKAGLVSPERAGSVYGYQAKAAAE
tara:strand:- start:809 stop:2485 length:1677 start_codon:yes stop_codon:yes gene_type:complete